MTHPRSSLGVAIALLALGGCPSTEPDEQAELEALLQDAPLAGLPPAAIARVDASLVAPGGDPIGAWDFDDCAASQTQLIDATGHDNTAFRSVGVACVAGVAGSQAVAIAAGEDLVYVPDQPSFRFDDGVTVAGWFNPAATRGTRTLFRKRDRGTSSFALLLRDHRFELVLGLGEHRAIHVTAPARARVGVFQHVAATYDGSTARLYVDGAEVGHVAAAGTIPVGPGPLLIGNDGAERRFSGAIDGALFATHALGGDEIAALQCVPRPPTMVVTPTELVTAPGEAATIDLALTNHSTAACAPIRFELRTEDAGAQVVVDPPAITTLVSGPAAGGATVHYMITVTPSALLADAAFDVRFAVREPTTGFDEVGAARLVVHEPAGCHVSTPRELMITQPSVVDDPVRTAFDPASPDAGNGVWTFQHLMENLAPTPEDARAMVEAMLASLATDQVINGFAVAARPGIVPLVLAPWPRRADGALDLARAPLRLQAIVNRVDLRDLARGDAGEGRFVFAFNNPSFAAGPLDALLIFEYKLPAATEQDVLAWAQAFHALGALPFGEGDNAALQAITERFVARGARPGHPNGSALNVVRSNEFAFRATKHGPWELRQFELSPVTGRLEPALLSLTPDASFDATATLASYINANQAAILAESHVVPAVFAGQPFAAGAIPNFGAWTAPGIDPEARHHFSLNTCNGCHNAAETGTSFSQITPRSAGGQATLSHFLTGATIADVVTGQPRSFHDLGRRKADLAAIVCPDAPGAQAARLRKGIARVH